MSEVDVHEAVRRRDLRAVKRFPAGESLRRELETGYTPLHLACLLGDLDMVDHFLSLLPHNTPLSHLKSNRGRTPLHCAVSKGHLQLVSPLLRKFPSILSIKDACGWTALHSASSQGRTDIVQMLVDRFQADMMELTGDVEPSESLCAGALAIQDNQLETVQFLLERGQQLAKPWWALPSSQGVQPSSKEMRELIVSFVNTIVNTSI